jgi:hypothetical protein
MSHLSEGRKRQRERVLPCLLPLFLPLSPSFFLSQGGRGEEKRRGERRCDKIKGKRVVAMGKGTGKGVVQMTGSQGYAADSGPDRPGYDST